MLALLAENGAMLLGTLLALVVALILHSHHKHRCKLPPIASITYKGVNKCLAEGNMHRYILKTVAELGLVFRLQEEMSFTHHFVVCDSGLARLILEGDKTLSPGEKRNDLKNVDKVTLNTPSMFSKQTHGEGWDWARKNLSPAFSNTNLIKTLPEIHKKTAEFTDILDQHINEGKDLADFSRWMVKLTIDFISTTMFSTDFQTLSHEDHTAICPTYGSIYLTHLSIAIKELFLLQRNDILRRLAFWSKGNRDAKDSAKKVAEVGQAVLDRFRNNHTKEELMSDESIIGRIHRGPYPSDIHRIADITICMLAGHDTTAHQISWIVVELSRHPLVVKKLRQELDSVLAPTKGPRNCTSQQLSELQYLQKIIKEGMRLNPVAANGVERRVLVDTPYKEFTIPKGSTVAINFFTMFRMGISNGDEFIPERWDSDNPDHAKLSELFIPFSTGRRNCIGQSLALLELKLVLATLYYSYDFEIVGEYKEAVSLTMTPENLNLRVTKRVM